MADVLDQRGVPYTLNVGPAGHEISYWSGNLEMYLRWYAADASKGGLMVRQIGGKPKGSITPGDSGHARGASERLEPWADICKGQKGIDHDN
jgi:hypothetical protein